MKLPDGYKIIGLIIADVENAEGEILWDDYFLAQNKDISGADILKDILGLAERKYNQFYNIVFGDNS